MRHQNTASDRLYGLDALRGVAAIAVVFGHIKIVYGTEWFVGNYVLAVDFFFMLSGFVMARTYERRLAGGLTTFHFMRGRVRRLFWPSAIGATLYFVFIVMQGRVDLSSLAAFVSALLFLPFPFWNGTIFPFNDVRWSLFCELFANLIHALVLAHLKTWHLVAILVAVTVPLSMAIHRIDVWPVPRLEAEIFVLALGRTMVPYIIGILIFRCMPERDTLRVRPTLLCSAFMGSLLLWGLAPSSIWNLAFVFLVCPVFVVAGSRLRLDNGQENWARAAGEISYPLYAVHMPILWLMNIHFTSGQAVTITLGLIAAALIWRARPVGRMERLARAG